MDNECHVLRKLFNMSKTKKHVKKKKEPGKEKNQYNIRREKKKSLYRKTIISTQVSENISDKKQEN